MWLETRVGNQRLTESLSDGFDTFRVMSILGYARVSTIEQNPQLQLDALVGAGCERIWTDHASGVLDQRFELAAVLDYLRPGDTLVVWRLDRLARSTRHLLELSERFAEQNIGLRSLTEAIDTTTPAGRLVFHIFGAIAEFERDLIKERTQAGLAAARARGRVGGRPTKMTPQKIAIARRLRDERELTMAQIADTIGVSRPTLYRHLNQQPPVSEARPASR